MLWKLLMATYSVVWKAAECLCQAAGFLFHIYLKIRSKIQIHYETALNITENEKCIFVFLPKNLAWTQQQWRTLCNPHRQLWYSVAERTGYDLNLPSPLLSLWVHHNFAGKGSRGYSTVAVSKQDFLARKK
jgi:hypothetical protein